MCRWISFSLSVFLSGSLFLQCLSVYVVNYNFIVVIKDIYRGIEEEEEGEVFSLFSPSFHACSLSRQRNALEWTYAVEILRLR